MIEITRTALAELAPRPTGQTKGTIWDEYVDAIVEHGPELCDEYDIDTRLEWCHFVAQIAHESGGFTILWESGAYSESQIMRIFGVGKHSAKVTQAEAREIAALPVTERTEVLFERVYGLPNPRKARELGNTEPGDGWRYRGFGLIQVTGKADHQRYLEGDHSPFGALRAAFREWHRKGCNKHATRDDIERVTKLINGGHNGLADRKRYLALAKRIWKHMPDAPPAVEAPDVLVTPQLVKDVQARLAELGYRPGHVDGKAGAATRAAILSFQDVNGLKPDGQIARDLVTRLISEEAKPFPISDDRKSLTVDDLRERGSTEIADGDNIKTTAKAVVKVTTGTAVIDAISGGGVADVTLAFGERVQGLAARIDPTGKVMGFLLSPRTLTVLAALLVAYGLYRFASHIQRRRVERARTGKDLSR